MPNYRIPIEIVKLFGPFIEFKQNGAIVSLELENGQIINQVLLIYPNEVLAIQGCKKMSFDPDTVVKVFQTETDLKTRTTSDWSFFDAADTSYNK